MTPPRSPNALARGRLGLTPWTLDDVYIVDSDDSVIRQLLQHCTSWHQEVDVWIGQVDILRSGRNTTGTVIPDDVAFT